MPFNAHASRATLSHQVRRYESTFTIQFSILDWDKISGNDFIGEATYVCPASELLLLELTLVDACSIALPDLMADVPEPNPETGIHEGDGKHEMREFKVRALTPLFVSFELTFEGRT